MRLLPGLFVLAAASAPAVAHAAGGTAFSETSRAAAMANAVSAAPGDAGTILLNPAGLADVTEPTVLLGGHVDHLAQWFQRSGEARDDRGRWFGGTTLAGATPLPGPAWLRRVRVGFAMDLPAAHALRVAVPVRLDEPSSPIYDARPERLSLLGAIAVQLFDRVRLGAGVALTPSLATPTEVTYVAGRDTTVDRSVVVRLDRSLELDAAPFVGLRAQPLAALGLGVTYRAAAVSHASGAQRTVAGGILADDPVDFLQFWDPSELCFGAAVGPTRHFLVTADVTFHQWSRFRSGFDQPLAQPFRDTLSVRSGMQWEPRPWLALRGGWAFEPSPIPEQVGETNYLGASTVVMSLGGGIDLRELVHAPLVVDAHVRSRFGALQSATKQASALPDRSADLPGQQIDNLGYPGFQSRSSSLEAGITLTLFVGKEHP